MIEIKDTDIPVLCEKQPITPKAKKKQNKTPPP